MKKVEVNYTDPITGATSAIDNIVVPEWYTPEDYINECIVNDDGYRYLEEGTVTFVESEVI